ncbi:peptide/nickel transport system permease protein [Luteococcus japonicus]|uniref:Peptide/nickel transport system permease protein n=1 Tax=Luteococcus japonicus TaxID=33984 RepID=A0A3N1ZV64_9ACTN|nr:dipeptide/oligopeptide/nickel ABC transporter permease/ATP-binding protein [Luteococcus japonicus]ROR54743.1 peptide/nickel transport system permease protein [Luteococcus japonicus]
MRRELTQKLSEPGLRLRALPLSSRIALALLTLVALLAVLAPVVSQFDPLASDTPASAPDGTHWFGTDAIGRDIFSRVVHGARASLVIGLSATLVALAAAAVLGSIAATANKWVSELLMRVLDVIMSFPGIALAAVFVAVWGSSLPVLVLAIAFLYTPQLTRVVRANVMAQFGEDYVSASRVMGSGTSRILLKHVARNCIAPILVFATVLVADAIVFEASLSFINAGVKPPNPSWGNVLADGKQLLQMGGWWATMFPGLAILLTVLALNILSEGMTDAMVSPTLRRKVRLDDPVEDSTAAVAPALAQVATEAVPLEDRLAALAKLEASRDTRLVYTGDAAPLLEVRNLSIRFPGAHGEVNVVDDVSFSVRPGETMGLVGESGCGKSITSMAIMGLLSASAELSGQIIFDGVDVLGLNPKQHNDLRGHEIAMIYQDALSSLNPSMLIRTQLKQLTSRGGQRSAEELLELVGLDPRRTLASYPHELSGGQRQRVLIAMALTRNPKLVIADEPTTALDVTVQKQVIDLLNDLREKLGFAMVFVSHDLALVSSVSHKITVMYAGQVVESGPTREILLDPRHEYTRGLLGAVLSIESGQGRLHQVPGVVPSPREFVPGDRFSPRSSHPEIGRDHRPVLVTVPGTEHAWASHANAAMAEEATR